MWSENERGDEENEFSVTWGCPAHQDCGLAFFGLKDKVRDAFFALSSALASIHHHHHQ